MNNLEDFLRPTQKQLFKRLCKKFKGNATTCKDNFILVHGLAPILLVAHLDTVHIEPVQHICKSKDGNILMSPQGIGGDDRCGVFALLKIYHAAKVKPWLLFTCKEEVGGLGAKNFCLAHKHHQLPNDLDALKFLIELDRRGMNDAVFYDCDNPDFEAYITAKGFKTAQGSFSDISLIAPELGIAAVNLSCGYYFPHSLHEYINRAHLECTIQKVLSIISESNIAPRFEYAEKTPLAQHIQHFRHYTTSYQPKSIPPDLHDLYETLLDFYSVAELESFRAEYGDHILWQIYNDEVAPLYHY